jgi:uncharacterized protein DUF2514
VIEELLSYRWMAIALLAAAAVGFMGIQRAQIAGLRADLAEGNAAWSAERAQAAKLSQAAEAAARVEEQRRFLAQQEALDAAEQKAVQARADAARASDAAGRLQQRVAALVAQAGRAAANPATAASGPAASDAGLLLTNMFQRIDQRAGELAEYADHARIAGEACQDAYESLTPR